MIKADDNSVLLRGTGKDIMYNFACIIQCLAEKGIIDKPLMHEMIETFAMSDREKLKQKLIDEIDEMENIGDALNLLGQVLNDRRFK